MNAPFDGYAYLNIVPGPNTNVNGVLISLSEKELALLSPREEGYTLTDVTEHIDPAVDGMVVAFIAPDIECSLKVPRSYLMTCMSSIPELEREKWLAETVMWGVEEDGHDPIYEFAA